MTGQKLTEAQRRELKHMLQFPGARNIRFQTGESLRRRGLATRYTVHAVAAFYATQGGVNPQYDHSGTGKFITWHEWEITPAGRASLSDARTGEEGAASRTSTNGGQDHG